MKKCLSLLLCVALLVCFSACTRSQQEEKRNKTNTQIVTDADGNVLDTLTEYTVLSDGRLQVTYYGVKSIQMREMYYFTAYVGDEVASQSVGYSVEAYAKSNASSTNSALADTVLHCMYYGDSAVAYFAGING